MTELAKWERFYTLIGSSGAALIGMQFVVMTLIASMRTRPNAESIRAFGTPTVVHLGVALVVSAVMNAPWPSLLPASVAVATCGLGGLGYKAFVIHCARRQTGYKPVWEDWIWYVALPSCAYAALAIAALLLPTNTQLALFAIGGAALGLLLIAIHNAWDSVSHIVVTIPRDDETKSE